jgi:hypothetical protein
MDPDDYPTEIRTAYQPVPANRTGRLVIAAAVVLAVAGGAAGVAYAWGERAGTATVTAPASPTPSPTPSPMDERATCRALAPELEQIAALARTVADTRYVDQDQKDAAKALKGRLAKIRDQAPVDWRDDIDTQANAAAMIQSGALPTDFRAFQSSGLRLVAGCLAYTT